MCVCVVVMTQQQLISFVDTHREKCGLSHAQFIQRVGISKQLWWCLRAGERSVSLSFIRAVLAQWPDAMMPAVTHYLLGDSPSEDTGSVEAT